MLLPNGTYRHCPGPSTASTYSASLNSGNDLFFSMQILQFWRSIDLIPSSGLRYTTICTIYDFNVALPMLCILPSNEILHISIRTVRSAALDRRISAMAELIEIILYAPIPALVERVTFPDFTCKYLICVAVAMSNNLALGVAEHGFTH